MEKGCNVMAIRISIIVPCYGVEKYLDRCMNSLLNQTLRDIEIILVDDGSPDNCPKMCDDYAKKDGRVKVIHKKNGGLGFARNSGLDVATGEYVAFVDSDDYIAKEAYQNAYDTAILENADYITFGNYIERNSGVWHCEALPEYKCLYGNSIHEYLLDTIACAPGVKQERKYNMSVWHCLYRLKIIRDYSISFLSEREIVCEDIPFQIDFLQHANKIVMLPQIYYYYCLNDISLTSSFKFDKFEKHVRLHSLLLKKLSLNAENTSRVDRFFIGYVRSYCLNIFKAKRKDSYRILEYVVNSPIWEILKQRYNPRWLPLYQGLLYWLILNKQILGISLLCKFVNFIRFKR